jgi:hypothetical protein
VINHHSGRSIKHRVAAEYKAEEEILFKPGVQFKVVNGENRADHTLVFLEEM